MKSLFGLPHMEIKLHQECRYFMGGQFGQLPKLFIISVKPVRTRCTLVTYSMHEATFPNEN